MRIWEMIDTGDMEALAARMATLQADLDSRIRATHRKMDQCSNWETWTEEDVPCETPEGIKRMAATFDGCRKHHVKILRND